MLHMKPTHQPDWLRDLPNQLTLFRIAVIPVLLFLYPLDFRSLRLFCALLLALAALTDWLDGYIARRFEAESRIGALLDPVADKMLTCAALILVTRSEALWAWMAGLLLCREMGMSGLRLVAREQGIDIKVNSMGKWKTLTLDVALVCLLVNEPLFGWPFREVGMISVWSSLLLSYASAWLYVREFWGKYMNAP